MYSSLRCRGLRPESKHQWVRRLRALAMDSAHSTDSSLREKLIEHLFIGELLRYLWIKGVRQVEVLRPEVDRGGYDVVLECNGVLRHVQLKSSYRLAKTSRIDVNLNLTAKPSGCVIWIFFDADTLALGPFLWFGKASGHDRMDLGQRVAHHTRGRRDGTRTMRPNIRVLRKGQFEHLSTVSDIAKRLFGREENLTSSSEHLPEADHIRLLG